LFLFTVVLFGVGGVICIWYCVICRLSSVDLIVSIWFWVPKLTCRWWMQRMCIASGYVSSVFGFCGFVGMSYVMVSAAKCARTCVSGNGPTCGE
jgi:hypothetical protein